LLEDVDYFGLRFLADRLAIGNARLSAREIPRPAGKGAGLRDDAAHGAELAASDSQLHKSISPLSKILHNSL
jgi:hypothetical protein